MVISSISPVLVNVRQDSAPLQVGSITSQARMTWQPECALSSRSPHCKCIQVSLCNALTSCTLLCYRIVHFNRCCVYRELVNLVDAATSFAASGNKLTGGDNGRSCILGVIVSWQTKDLTTDAVSRLVSLYNRLHDARVITDGAAATERGDKKGHHHVQACFWLPRLNRNAAEVQAYAMNWSMSTQNSQALEGTYLQLCMNLVPRRTSRGGHTLGACIHSMHTPVS
jgi:hypothetical protein